MFFRRQRGCGTLSACKVVDISGVARGITRWTGCLNLALRTWWANREAVHMSRLLAIIDEYKDTHGSPSDSSIARAIGVKPQTISSWRQRGLKDPPDRDALRELARLVNLDYESVVLRAVLLDVGWIDEDGEVSRRETS